MTSDSVRIFSTFMLMVILSFGCETAVGGNPDMTMKVRDDSLIIGGYLDHSKFSEFSKIVDASAPQKIIFNNVIGGSPASVYMYRTKILGLNIETQIDGNCFSACALVFLAGQERSVLLPHRSAIAFHGPRNPSGEEMPKFRDAYKAQIKNRTQGKFPDDLVNLALNNIQPGGALFFNVDSIFGIRTTWVIYCEQEGQCRKIYNADPYEFLIFTK
jgi:hypothetical protein